jgi:hypothetical protein
MRVVPKCSFLYRLSNGTSLEKKLVGSFLCYVFTLKTGIKQYKMRENVDFQSDQNSIKSPKIRIHLRLTIYLCDHFGVRKQWLEAE